MILWRETLRLFRDLVLFGLGGFVVYHLALIARYGGVWICEGRLWVLVPELVGATAIAAWGLALVIRRIHRAWTLSKR